MHFFVCGCGALGSQIALHIALQNDHFYLIDDDRVGLENVGNGTSLYHSSHVDKYKAVVLAEMLYRRAWAYATPDTTTFDAARRRIIEEAHKNILNDRLLVIDAFDNAEARRETMNLAVPTLHVGVSANGTGAVLWGEQYILQPNAPARGQRQVCTHALGRQILRFTAAVAAGIIDHFRDTGDWRAAVVNQRMEAVWL